MTDDSRESIAALLRKERLRRGKSQEWAARDAGVSTSAWRKWEAGATPRIGNLERLEDAWELPRGFFYYGGEPPTADGDRQLSEMAGRMEELARTVQELRSEVRRRLDDIDGDLRRRRQRG